MMDRLLRQLPFVVGVIALYLGLQQYANHGLAAGEPPALAGQTIDGTRFDLQQMRGRPVVIYFWASWCGICSAMQSTMSAIAQDHPVISVAMQSGDRQEVGRYMQQKDFHLATLLDEDGTIADRYGLRGVPAVFILGADGKIRSATTGYTSELGLRLRLWWAGL